MAESRYQCVENIGGFSHSNLFARSPDLLPEDYFPALVDKLSCEPAHTEAVLDYGTFQGIVSEACVLAARAGVVSVSANLENR